MTMQQRMNLYNLIFRMVFLLYTIKKMGTNGGGGVVTNSQNCTVGFTIKTDIVALVQKKRM
jgi:K+-transporting ATPase A subunit